MATDLLTFKLQMHDEMSAQIKKTRKITKSALGDMSKAHNKLTQKIEKEEDALRNLNKQQIKNGKNVDKILSAEIKHRKAVIAQVKKQASAQKRLDDIKNKNTFTDKINKGKGGINGMIGKGGGATAVAGAVIAGGIAFDQMIKDAEKVNTAIKSAFGGSDIVISKLSIQVRTLGDIFEEDYNDIIQSANTLSKEMGISGEAAMNLIEEGFRKGANSTGEFLDILKEYPVQLKKVGLSAEESVALITQQVTEGIYSDKGIDAIKEAGLRLEKNNKATQNALKLLPIQTREEVRLSIAKGKTFEAIQAVSSALEDTTFTAQDTQAIISDIFGGPGEDAGLRYLQSLNNINTKMSALTDTTSAYTKQQMELTKSWNTFLDTITGEGVFQDAMISVKSSLGDVLELFNDVFNADTWEDKLKAVANIMIRVLMGPINVIIEGLEMLGNIAGIGALKDLSDNFQFDVNRKGDKKTLNTSGSTNFGTYNTSQVDDDSIATGDVFRMKGVSNIFRMKGVGAGSLKNKTAEAERLAALEKERKKNASIDYKKFLNRRKSVVNASKQTNRDLTNIETSKAVKSLSINIDALNKGGIDITTNNISESPAQLEKMFTEMLINVVNQSGNQIFKN